LLEGASLIAMRRKRSVLTHVIAARKRGGIWNVFS
jgi:hypothetical protein